MAKARDFGHCQRCGKPYETAVKPTCECAGDPPIRYDGTTPPNFDPEQRKYLAAVRALRWTSKP